jgi:hypothetical protein
MYRAMSSGKSFSAWAEERQNKKEGGQSDGDSFSVWGQFSSLQDSFVGQMQDMYGILPDAGPLSADFRARLMNAVYLIIAALFFALLAVFVGIPTIVLRPSKFVLCLTLCTLLAASSVIVLQKPSVFFSNLITGGLSQSLPVVLLFSSVIFTLYVTVFYHRYFLTIFAGVVQIVCLIVYLMTFIPGGTTGLQLIWRAIYAIISTTLTPCLFVTKQTVMGLCRTIISS